MFSWVHKVGFLLPTIQLTGAAALNGLALILWLITCFTKDLEWIENLHKSEVVSTLWYLIPSWLWPTVSLGGGGGSGGWVDNNGKPMTLYDIEVGTGAGGVLVYVLLGRAIHSD